MYADIVPLDNNIPVSSPTISNFPISEPISEGELHEWKDPETGVVFYLPASFIGEMELPGNSSKGLTFELLKEKYYTVMTHSARKVPILGEGSGDQITIIGYKTVKSIGKRHLTAHHTIKRDDLKKICDLNPAGSLDLEMYQYLGITLDRWGGLSNSVLNHTIISKVDHAKLHRMLDKGDHSNWMRLNSLLVIPNLVELMSIKESGYRIPKDMFKKGDDRIFAEVFDMIGEH